MGSAVHVESNSNSPAVRATPGGSNTVLVVSSSPAVGEPKVSRAVAQVGLVCALALMTLCLTILAVGAIDGRPYPRTNSTASVDPPAQPHLQAIANRR